jgi:hypothetical protein
MAESFDTLPDTRFLQALLDAAMTAPGGATPLFDPAYITCTLGNQAAINGPSGTFTLPLPKPILSVDSPLAVEQFYSSLGPDGDNVTYERVTIPFVSWSNDGTTDQEVKRRLLFARDMRKYVFASYGLLIVSMARENFAGYLVPDGIYRRNYWWEFDYTRIQGP